MKMNNNDELPTATQGDPLDDLLGAWQMETERLGRVSTDFPARGTAVHAVRGHRSTYRSTVASSAIGAAVCMAALVWLACSFRHYAVDAYDLVPHLLVGCGLAYGAVTNLRTAIAFSTAGTGVHRIMATAALAATLLIAATPAYNGRSMSVRNHADRTVKLDKVYWITDHAFNTEIS
jgi:hypothetical protein